MEDCVSHKLFVITIAKSSTFSFDLDIDYSKKNYLMTHPHWCDLEDILLLHRLVGFLPIVVRVLFLNKYLSLAWVCHNAQKPCNSFHGHFIRSKSLIECLNIWFNLSSSRFTSIPCQFVSCILRTSENLQLKNQCIRNSWNHLAFFIKSSGLNIR